MDKQEFTLRVRGLTDRLYRIAYGQLREPQDRLDAVQNALLKAWSSRHTLRRAEYFDTWLIRILINECHDLQRAQKRTLPMDPLPEPPAPADHTGELHDAILLLPEKQRICIILHYMAGYRTSEIARILRIPDETVRSRLKRARAALKHLLTEDQ